MTFTKSIRYSTLTLLVATLSACGNAGSADAQATSTASETKAEAPAGNWDIVASESYLRFTAAQEGEPFTGSFGEFSGIINFDPDNLDDSYVRIDIPLNSVDAGSTDRNSTLPGKVWFSTKAFPTAVYETGEIITVGDGYESKGTLTLKGTTMPVELFFNLTIEGNTAIMDGQATLDRTQWDVGAAPWNTDEYVSKAVEIDVKVTANRR